MEKEKVLRCLWCGKFVSGYDEFCDDDCWQEWIQNTDIDGKKTNNKSKDE